MKITRTGQTRKDLVKLFSGKFCEVGTERGKYAEQIAQVVSKLYVVDLWKNYPGYREHVSDREYEDILSDAHKRLDKYDTGFIRADSVSASKLFEDNYLDGVYLDANHTREAVYNDLVSYFPKVKSGGIISGHDYNTGFGKKDGSEYGVIEAVNKFAEEQGVEELFIYDGDNRNPSWMFKKR